MKNEKTLKILLGIVMFCNISLLIAQDKYFTKSGHVNFYSHTLVEDIEADNNQVLSILDINTGEMVIKILMRSFRFEKALMQEHFNENYIESHKYPKATFKGTILNIDDLESTPETLVKGKLTIRGIEKDVEIKTKIRKSDGEIVLKGVFHVKVSDFNIKIPSVVSKNISKTIKITFDLKHKPYNN